MSAHLDGSHSDHDASDAGTPPRYRDMLVETPVPLTRISNRSPKYEHDGQNQCSTCGTTPDKPWYPIEDVAVVRHWQVDDGDDPDGGIWWWYCPEHLDKWGEKWWPNSHRAPAQLLPEVRHYCQRSIGSREKCGVLALENVDGAWFCAPHAAAANVDLRIRRILDEDRTDN